MQFDIFILDYNINQQLKIAHSSILRALLRVGKIQKITQSLDEVLLQHCGVHKQQDWPLAAIDAINLGTESTTQFWRATPVSLSLLRDSFALEQKVTLTADELRDLTVLFCQFFAEDGLKFIPAQQGGWLVQHQKNWVVETHHLQQVLGRNVAQFQASGQDAKQLRALQNQLQMLLHEHPINQAREAAGLPICNSLWLYGGGLLPVKMDAKINAFVGNADMIKTLANLAEKPVLAFNQLEQQLQADNAVIVLENALDLSQLDTVLKNIKNTQFNDVNIYLNVNDQTYLLRYQAQDHWKFWRRAKPFEAYFV